MLEPSMEPEQAVAELRAMGCPYDATDARAAVWLAGFMAGTKDAQKDAERIVNEAFYRGLQGGAEIARG